MSINRVKLSCRLAFFSGMPMRFVRLMPATCCRNLSSASQGDRNVPGENVPENTSSFEDRNKINNLIIKIRNKHLSGQLLKSSLTPINSRNASANPQTDHIDSHREGFKIRQAKEDDVVELEVSVALKENGLDKAMLKLQHYAYVNRYPAKKTLLVMTKIAAEAGNIQCINSIQEICKKAFPIEFQWQMQYQHYYAEALWKMGNPNYKEAISIFEKLLLDYPQQRKKVSSMITFLVRSILRSDLEEDLALLIASVKSCANAGAHHAAANVWFYLFTSTSGRNQLLASDIIKDCPDIKPFIITKVDSLLRNVVEHDTCDILYRFIEVLHFLQATTEYSTVYSALLDYQCMEGHLAKAVKTFEHMYQEKIPLDSQVFQKYQVLLQSYRNADLPSAVPEPNVQSKASSHFPKFRF